MEWTAELNDLLNQCVFECGYEFTDACRLLQSRARTLRLIPEGECGLTADVCQVQWMTINPMDEDDEYDNEGEYDDHHGTPWHYGSELHLHQQVLEMDFLREAAFSDNTAPFQQESAGDASLWVEDQCEKAQNIVLQQDPSRSSAVADSTLPPPRQSSPRRTDAPCPMYECAPLLELSISEAELDLLISSLPETQPEDSNNSDSVEGESSADEKHAGRPNGGSSSEMQWVLSFLTDPDDAAQRDAEAKSLLENLEKHDDDNYQYFLQELNQANMLLVGNGSSSPSDQEGSSDSSLHAPKHEAPSDPNSVDCDATQALARLQLCAKAQEECRGAKMIDASHSTGDPIDEDGSDADEDADDDDEDWEIVRQSIKTQATRQVAASTSTHIVSSASSSFTNISIQESRVINSRFMPPLAPSSLSRGAGSENLSDANSCGHHHYSQKNHRIALSREIGDLLKTHGEFQFPKHMFPHHNDALAAEK